MADLSRGEKQLRQTTSQSLATPLNFTTSFSADVKILAVLVAFTNPAGNIEVLVDYNSSDGANYDTRLLTQDVNNNSDMAWWPDQELMLTDGDELDITVPADSGNTAYVTVLARAA